MDTQTIAAVRRLGPLDVPGLRAEAAQLRQQLQVLESLLVLAEALPHLVSDDSWQITPRPPLVTARPGKTPDALSSGVVRSHKDVLPPAPTLVGKAGPRLSERLSALVEEFVTDPAPPAPLPVTPIELPPRPELARYQVKGKFRPEYKPSVDPLDPPERPATLAVPAVTLPAATAADLRHAVSKQYTLPDEATLARVKLPEKKAGGRGMTAEHQQLIQQLVLYLAHAGVSTVRAICDTLGCKPAWAYRAISSYPQLFRQAGLHRGWLLTEAAQQQLAAGEG